MDSDRAQSAIVDFLEALRVDEEREGFEGTPKRVAKAYDHLTEGYEKGAGEILSTTFSMAEAPCGAKYDGMVLLQGCEFYSLCEHHILPFVGRAHVGYIPDEDDGQCVGLSKLARLVDCFSRRLQCQERITAQIADALNEHLEPLGAFAVLEASHFCMRMRGVSKEHSTMTTSAVRGVFREKDEARAEALSLIGYSGGV